MKKTFLFLLIPSITLADGYLSIIPTHDALQGNGSVFSLDGDVPLEGKWYLNQEVQLATVEKYRSADSKLDLEYRWSELFSTSLGAGYSSFHAFGNDRIESEDVHIKLKVKVW